MAATCCCRRLRATSAAESGRYAVDPSSVQVTESAVTATLIDEQEGRLPAVQTGRLGTEANEANDFWCVAQISASVSK
mgnify:CR=1 FL=1